MAKFPVASKGQKTDGNYWVKLTKETPEGFIDEGFLTVAKKIYDIAVEGEELEVPNSRAAKIEWRV